MGLLFYHFIKLNLQAPRNERNDREISWKLVFTDSLLAMCTNRSLFGSGVGRNMATDLRVAIQHKKVEHAFNDISQLSINQKNSLHMCIDL